MTNNTRKYTRLTAAAALLGMSSTPILGAGFQLAERSVSGLGRAYSGEAAIADDASVLASNAAGIIMLEDGALSAGLQYINPQVDVSGINAVGAAVSDSDIAEHAFVPNFYYTRKISDDLTAGLGIYAPFGLATSYSKSFASLVGTETSEITTVSINPSLAFRLNEQWTVGAGFSVMYVDGKLTALNTVADGVPGAVGGTLFALEGDDWAYGWNIGVLFEATENTRIGLQYRSSFDVGIEGTAKGDLIDAATLTPNNSADTTLDIELPDVAELSVFHQINDTWAVHADVTWTGWSKFKALSPKTGTPADAALATTENWDDAFRYAIGATYKHSDKVTFRAGVAYDESPVPGIQNRTLRIPDADRLWVSIGATIKLNACYNLDLGYTHIFADEADVTFKAAGGNEGQFRGTAEGDVDLFGIGISGKF